MLPPARIVTRSPAKINLGLYILRKRSDGYHNLLTVFHRIALADTVTLEQSDDVEVHSSDPGVPENEENICHRAVLALQHSTGVRRGARIMIEKRIPLGGGLGGGSSNAAAVISNLPGLWGITIEEPVRQAIGASLGADVPFFLQHRSALATGRGDVLHPFDLHIPYTILVCSPGIIVSTAWAYGAVTPADRPGLDLLSIVTRGMHDPELLRSELENDFERVVFAAHPLIGELKEHLLRTGAVYAAMSGSGSSVFGFFPEREAAQAAARALRDSELLVSLTPPDAGPA
jgi:4-diphosphocytidyl-2-C-methyl-D-erythritol kinase